MSYYCTCGAPRYTCENCKRIRCALHDPPTVIRSPPRGKLCLDCVAKLNGVERKAAMKEMRENQALEDLTKKVRIRVLRALTEELERKAKQSQARDSPEPESEPDQQQDHQQDQPKYHRKFRKEIQ